MVDLINRQATIRAVCESECTEIEPCKGECGAIWAIRGMPSAQPKRGQGRWNKIHWKAFRCSECNRISEYSTDFCPSCGSDMRGEQE